MNITHQTTLSELITHPNPIISRHALGILKEARRQLEDTPQTSHGGWPIDEEEEKRKKAARDTSKAFWPNNN